MFFACRSSGALPLAIASRPFGASQIGAALIPLPDDGGRVRADVGGLDAREAGVIEPARVLGERVGVAALRVDEHVEGEDELVGRACARVVRQHVYDDDAASTCSST